MLEAGFAIASPGDFESVKAISETIGQRPNTPVIASLARAGQMDVMSAADALRPAKRKRIHIVIATSDLHMKYKLRLSQDEVIAATVQSVTLARQHADDVEWSAEDATRSDIDFLARVVEAAIGAGATTINLPDTVGYALPEDMERMFTSIRTRVPGADKVILSTHNHNDLGLAVANTIAAIRAGVRQVECTINGIGERAGNASLEEIVMAVRTRHDAIPYANRIVTEHLLRTSKLLSTVTTTSSIPAQQGDRRSQRLRPRGRHPPGRRAEKREDVRDHDAGERRLGEKQSGARKTFRPRGVPRQAEHVRLPDWRQPVERRVPPASRISPTARRWCSTRTSSPWSTTR